MTAPSAADVIRLATGEVGVHEGKSGGSWNNIQKYSKETPGFDWSNGQPWCDTFVAWCSWKAGFAEADWTRSASCDTSGAAFKKAGRWSDYPAIGAQVFFGTSSDLQHTGIVTAFDDTYIHTVEGNTNATGSYQGDGVYAKIHERRDARVIGYGYPKFPEGIVSADPAWQKPATGGLTPKVADISHWNAGPFDYAAALTAGLRIVMLKATEGTGYVDPTYAARRDAIRGLPRQGLLRRKLRTGAYHFAKPKRGDAAAQAKHFLDVAGIKRGDARPWLDLEDDGGLSRADLTAWVGTWVAAVEAAIGRKPMIYTKYDLDDNFGCLLVTSRYSDSNHAPYIAKPWDAYDLWQFTDGVYGRPSSFPGLGHCDLSTVRSGLPVRSLLVRRHKPKPPPVEPPPPPKAPLTIRHAHSSGRFDRSPASLEKLTDALMAEVNLITVTEVATEARGVKLAEKGWDHYRGPNKPGADECAILWDASVSRLIAADSVQVTDLTYDTVSGGRMAPVHVAIAVLEDIATTRTTLVTVGHYPSSVQGRGGPEGFWNTASPHRTAAHKAAVAGTMQLVDEWVAKYDPDAVAICGDWNLNIASAAIRAWFAEQFSGYVPNWPEKPKGKGTLGHRWIDVAFLGGLKVAAGPVVHSTDASDHRYYIETLGSE